MIILVGAIRVESWEPDSTILVYRWLSVNTLGHVWLVSHQLCIKLYGFRILVVNAVITKRLSFSQLHHIFHQRDLSLELALVLARLFHELDGNPILGD